MSWKTAVYHNPSGIYLEGLAAGLGSQCTLRLRASHDSPVERVFLRTAPDGEQQMWEARAIGSIEGWDCRWWETHLPLHNPRTHYRFYVLTSQGGYWYTAAGLSRHVPTDHTDFNILADYHSPEWLDKAVFYQIFPDRFADGDPSNNVGNGTYQVDGYPTVARSWNELPNSDTGGREFFGGDLQGITQKLDYLQSTLGVNALYLNPIGTAPSNHKYDVASYSEVDPYLGGDRAFTELTAELRKRSMRVMLDIVPNHCGSAHPWFQAALRDPQGETAEYFRFSKHPDEYDCWLGHKSLPKLNYHSQALREVMYAGPDAAMRQWLRPPFQIDGWRVDVANMLARQGGSQLGHKVLRGMRRAVKAENPDCYFLGENFFDASSYLQGDELDATMNYRGFMMPLYHWLTGRDYNVVSERQWGDRHALSTEELEQQWRAFRSTVPWALNRQQFNLLGSHDTPRLFTLVSEDREKAAIARMILFTYPGVPCLYYGDELSMPGGRDPDNRRTMNWDESSWDRPELERWSALIRLRTSNMALARGCIQVVCRHENTLAFLREYRRERALVVARRAADDLDRVSLTEAAVANGTIFREFFSGREARVADGHLPILPAPTQIWLCS